MKHKQALRKYGDIFLRSTHFFPTQNLYIPALLCVKHDFVFKHKYDKKIDNIEVLTGLRLGLTRSYPYARNTSGNRAIDIRYLNTDELNTHNSEKRQVSSRSVYFGLQKNRSGGKREKYSSRTLTEL